MVEVHTCPFCELRFANRVEVEHHITVDHPGHIHAPVDDDTFPQPGADRGASRP
jgi:hypothetical protein